MLMVAHMLVHKFAQTFTTLFIELTWPMPLVTVLPLVQCEQSTRLSSSFCALASPWKGKMKQVDVSRLVVIAPKLQILKTSVQNARCEVLNEMDHKHAYREG